MNLSKREKRIVILAAAVLGLFVLDRYALTPFLDKWQQVSAERQRLTLELDAASRLLGRRQKLESRWRQMRASSLKDNAAEAESLALHAMRRWSEESGLSLSSLKPEYKAQQGPLQQIGFRLTATGTMRAAAGFLWDIETSSLPLKVEEMQLASVREGGRQMSLQVRVSTIYSVAGDSDGPPPGERENE